MKEVGDDDVEVEEAVGLALLLVLFGVGIWNGIGSGDVDGKVEVGEGAASSGQQGLEGAVGRHRSRGKALGGAFGAVALVPGERRERHSSKVRPQRAQSKRW